MGKALGKILLALLALLMLTLGGFFALSYTPDLDADLLIERYSDERSHFVTLPSGTKAHVQIWGDKALPNLVLLHGSNASVHTWHSLASLLQASYHIIAIDLPGHGLTGPTPIDDYSYKAMAQMVHEVVRELKLSPFIILGNSMGGAVSYRYALDYPTDLIALIGLDAGGVRLPPSEVSKKTEPPIAFKLAGKWYADWILKSVTPRSLVLDGLDRSISVKSIITAPMVNRYHDLARYPGARAATSKRFQFYRDNHKSMPISNIALPTLLIWGVEDKLIPLETGRYQRDLLKDTLLLEYEATGHLPMEERPKQTAEDVDKFIKSVMSRHRN